MCNFMGILATAPDRHSRLGGSLFTTSQLLEATETPCWRGKHHHAGVYLRNIYIYIYLFICFHVCYITIFIQKLWNIDSNPHLAGGEKLSWCKSLTSCWFMAIYCYS